ncbi:UNVERIFIED_CONTAM: hypothetical protein Sindi_3127100, partial [Sesamum indicum]
TSEIKRGTVMLNDPVVLVVDWPTVVLTPRRLVQFSLTTVPLTPWPGQFPVDVQQSRPLTTRPGKSWPWPVGGEEEESHDKKGGSASRSHSEL